MKLAEECKSCLYSSQLKKVERVRGQCEGVQTFKNMVKTLCDNPPENYCAPLLMRDIDNIHRDIFGESINYSREKTLFNSSLLKIENELYESIVNSSDALKEAVKYAMSANYIDFARMSDLDEGAVDYIIRAARQSEPDEKIIAEFKRKLNGAKTLLYLHDNCGEIVLDKILIRVIKLLYPQISVTSVVRGKDIINDVTQKDAEQIQLNKIAYVVDNGTNIPGTYLNEVSAEVKTLLESSDVIISKGLGNLETLYGEGYSIFYCFTCKCKHIAEQFNAPVWSSVFTWEE